MQRLLQFTQHRRAEILCAVLLFFMALNLIGQIRQKTITNDEVVLIPAGYYHLIAGKFHLVYEHPPLCKILSALPLLFIQPNEIKPETIEAKATEGDRAWAYQTRFWEDNGKMFQTISFWTRIPMIALTLGLGVLIFAFARELFGNVAALFAVALFTFEPTTLAHGRIVQTDIPAAFGFVLLLSTMFRYAAQPTARRAAWIGFAAALAMLAKFSMLLAGPILLVFFAARLWKRRPVAAHVLVICLTSLLVINAAYFFQHRALEPAEVEHLHTAFAKSAAVLVPATRVLSHFMPVEFILGVLWQITHSSDGHCAGFLGMYSKTGWWYYFPVAFALKTTWPFFFLSLTSLGRGLWRLTKGERHFLWLLLPFVVYTIFLMFTGINIGVRYYLPGFALLFILGGALLARLTRAGKIGMITSVAVVGWCALIAVRVYPDYMPYMNGFASRHPHWWYLSDSNVEWGDDVGPLARYLRARGERKVRAALLGGFMSLQFNGVDYLDVISEDSPLDTRYLALGASFLNGSTVSEDPSRRTEEQRVNRFDEYRRRQPEAIIGGSIYLYRVRD